MTHHYVAGEGALFTQPNGPNTQPVYLGCHQIGDIDEPQGDVELIYCPDPSGPSRFRVVNSLQGAAGAVTTSITTDVMDELDYLERAKCEAPIYIHMVKAGLKNLFTNYDRSFVLTGARITSRGLTGLTARTPDDNTRSEMTFELSGERLLRIVRLELARQTIAETLAINDLTFCNQETCGSEETMAMDACQIGFAVADAGAGTANVIRTTNGGTWTATAADPFAATEHAIAVECFEMGRDSTRVLVARGITDADDPAEVAYSDDNGATWVNVDVGAVDGAYVVGPQALFALDRSNIWLGTDGGYIYKSEDGGGSWVAQEAGLITNTAWHAIHFANELVGWAAGAANQIGRTLDGGESWGEITGPAGKSGVVINTVFAFDRNRAWIGFADGTLYYTNDGGVTWNQRTFSGSGVGQVRQIAFLNDYFGIMIRNNASPVGTALMTIDGGYTWEPLTTPTNSGLNAVAICNEWSFFVAGEPNGGTGYIAKASV